jgi:hypothetical protein
MKNTEKSANELNKATITKVFADLKIEKVEVEFDGCGDEGQIGSITRLDAEGNEVENTNISVEYYWNVTSYSQGKSERYAEGTKGNLNDLIEYYVYGLLCSLHGGWEINSGSFGTVTINKDGSGNIDYNERIEDVENYQTSF